MSDFINTVDVVGDELLIAQIINKTITEYKNDTIASVGAGAFMNCTSLVNVELPNVKTMENYTFQGCTALESISLPMLETAKQACLQGTGIKEINLPNVTSVSTSFLNECKSLERVYMPKLINPGNMTFNKCEALTDVYVPVLPKVVISTFASCKSLEIIDLPCVTSIAGWAFDGDSKLKAVFLRSETLCTLDNINAFTFTNSKIANGTGYIYVPRALVDSYKSATNWSSFANQFRALEDYTVDGTITGAPDTTKI